MCVYIFLTREPAQQAKKNASRILKARLLARSANAQRPSRGARLRQRGVSETKGTRRMLGQRQRSKRGRPELGPRRQERGPEGAAQDEVLQTLPRRSTAGRAGWRDAAKAVPKRPRIAKEFQRSPTRRRGGAGENGNEALGEDGELTRDKPLGKPELQPPAE